MLHAEGATRHSVGGFAQLFTTITPDAIVMKIIREWPDTVGQPLARASDKDYLSLDCAAWRAMMNAQRRIATNDPPPLASRSTRGHRMTAQRIALESQNFNSALSAVFTA